MLNKIGAAWLSVGIVIVTLVASAAPSWATPDSAAVAAVTDGASSLKDSLVAIAVAVLPFAAAILAITAGWRMAKRFVH